MIKVEIFKQNDGTSRLVFETNDKSEDGLSQLDDVYQALMGSDAKYGGYNNSFSFHIDVKQD